jgi:hypothetical protein
MSTPAAPDAPRPGPPGAPGGLARLTAAALTDAGFEVSGPDPGDADGRRLFICCPGGPYSLMVSDDGDAELQGDTTDPHRAAEIAAALLSPAPSPARHPDTASDTVITFKGIAGMDLKAKGFSVTLDIHTDDHYYDVTGEIAATSPDTDTDTGTVFVNDEGGLIWVRDYWPQHASTADKGANFRWHFPDPAAVARDIAASVTRALTPGTFKDDAARPLTTGGIP